MEEHSPSPGSALALMLVGVLLSLRWTKTVPHEHDWRGLCRRRRRWPHADVAQRQGRGARDAAHVWQHPLRLLARDLEFAAAAALVALVHTLFAKEFLFVSFDPETANALGYRTRFWEMLFYLTLGLTIAFAIRVAGVLLVFSLLVLPGVTALLLTRHLRRAFPVAILAGVLPIGIGLTLSYALDFPSAASIIMVSFVFMLLAGGARLVRG